MNKEMSRGVFVHGYQRIDADECAANLVFLVSLGK